MSHKIAASFKKDERPLDGLTAIEADMAKNPHDEWFVIARVVNRRTAVEHEDGDASVVTAKFVHIEPMWGDDETTAKALLNDAYKRRTGKAAPAPPKPEPTLFDGESGGEPADAGEQPDGDGEPVSEKTPDTWLDPAAKA